MKTEMTRPTWEDVVFESRNKEYGAYILRKSYNENISKASLMALLIAAFVFAALQIASLMRIEIKVIALGFKSGKLESLPTIIADQPKQKIIPPRDQPVNKELPVVVVKHEVVEFPPVKPIDATLAGSEPGTGTGVPISGTGLGKPEEIIPTVVEPPKFTDFAEVMPVYEGGLSAMIKFLRKNLHYPSSARMTGIEGSVYIRFVIDGQGAVTDVEVIKGINGALDKEAIRVIAKMPRWKPGRQHNLPVNVRMVLPIKFKLEGE